MRLFSDSVHLRVSPSSRAALGVGVAALVAAIVMTVWLLSDRPRAAPVAAVGTPLSSARASSVAVRPAAAGAVVVDVVGKVRRPGVYRLPTGARVQDALRAAGGALPGVADVSVNLAARLTDGEQVAIGMPGAAPQGAASTTGAPSGPVDLNTATEPQLESLPGVGPVLAQQVLAWRAAHGGFASVAQLDDVPGVGAAKFAELKPLVTV